jgi:hypothetical protein
LDLGLRAGTRPAGVLALQRSEILKTSPQLIASTTVTSQLGEKSDHCGQGCESRRNTRWTMELRQFSSIVTAL